MKMTSSKLYFLIAIGLLHISISSNAENSTSTPNATTSKTIPTSSSLLDPSSTGIPCTKDTNPCPLPEGFVCQDGFCKCAYPNLMYNKSTKKCLAKVGEQCGFFIGLKNASTVSCPENAICALINLEVVTDGHNNEYSIHQCACVYTHYKAETGDCVPLAKHGEICSTKRKCNTESDLVCVNGSCQCQFGTDQYYDHERNICISYAGGNCTRACVPNAVCDFWNSQVCQCRLDHRVNAQHQCEQIPPGYLAPCLGEKELCNSKSGLKCIDKVCQCTNPLHQIYDFQQDKCIGLAGDICSPDSSDNCVKNSKCVKTPGANHHACKCIDGFSTTPFRKCMKSHKEKCSNEFCNVYRGLACINGKCECYDSFLKYDDTSQACLSSVGSPCGKVFVPFPGDWVKGSCPECDSYYFPCESKSVCTRDFSQGTELGTLEKFRCQTKPEPN